MTCYEGGLQCSGYISFISQINIRMQYLYQMDIHISYTIRLPDHEIESTYKFPLRVIAPNTSLFVAAALPDPASGASRPCFPAISVFG